MIIAVKCSENLRMYSEPRVLQNDDFNVFFLNALTLYKTFQLHFHFHLILHNSFKFNVDLKCI